MAMTLSTYWDFYEPIDFRKIIETKNASYFRIKKDSTIETFGINIVKLNKEEGGELMAPLYFRCAENGIYLENLENKETAFRLFVPKEYENNILRAFSLTPDGSNRLGEQYICSVILCGTPEMLKGKPTINRKNVPFAINYMETLNGSVGWGVELLDNAERNEVDNEYLVNLQMSILEPVLADAKDRAEHMGYYYNIQQESSKDEDDSEDFGSFENIDPDNNKVIWEYEYCGSVYDLTSEKKVEELVSEFEDQVEEWSEITDRESDEWYDYFGECSPNFHIVQKVTLGDKVTVEYSYYLHYDDGLYDRVFGSVDGKTIKLDGKNINKLVKEFYELI